MSRKSKIELGTNEISIKEAVNFLKTIPFSKYEYKDKVQDGKAIVYGMIAEDVQRVAPSYVTETSKFIPNIFKYGTILSKTFGPAKQFEYVVDFGDTNISFNLDIESERFKGYTKDKEFEGTFLEFGRTWVRFFSLEEMIPGTKCFFYGTFENCPIIDKDHLFEMGLMVTQNLLNRIEVLETSLVRLENQFKDHAVFPAPPITETSTLKPSLNNVS